MAALVSTNVANPSLRMTSSWDDYRCAEDGSLWDLILLMRRDRREVEEILFIMRLSAKSPLLNDLPDEVVNRFKGCEPAIEDGVHGECLVLCAQLLGVAISLPLQERFDRDKLLVHFQEIAPDLELNDVEETIDNLARSLHATLISSRTRRRLLDKLTFKDLWASRATVFPNLVFGLDVEDQLRQINVELIGPVVKRLSELNDAAEEWPAIGTAAPRWRSKVSPESESVMNNVGLRNSRMFRDSQGRQTLFEWHARFGASQRIHFLFDRATFRVEIGYVGNHLPLN
jgi:hypothetical protein